MLKTLAILALIVSLSPSPYAQTGKIHGNPPNNQAHSDASQAQSSQRGTKDFPFVVDIEQSQQTPAEAADSKRKEDIESARKNWEIGLTGVIALAAVFQAIGVFIQVCVYLKQSGLMRVALAVSKKAADAADTSAKAAIANARAAVASVRPVIVVHIERHPSDSTRFIFRATNRGNSPAVLWGAECCFEDHPAEGFVPPKLLKCPIWLPPETIILVNQGFPLRDVSPSTMKPSPTDLFTVKEPKFYYVYGCIKYRDMFSDHKVTEPYETRWQFHYDSSGNRFIRTAGPYPGNT